MTSATPTAEERIDALMQIHPKGFDLSLDRITRLLEKLGNPQDAMPPVIHFAGTNGKGSTIAFTRAVLEAAGLSVHVHTSPHLVDWPERYRIGQKGKPGQLVEDAVLSDAIRRVAEANGGEAITVFEVLSAVMFVLFSENPADVALVEVGLGGRFDATNVMEKTALSVITPISLDHEAYLGDTIAKIAFEKAGIIKRNVPVIIGNQEDDALVVIEKQAARNGCAVQSAGQHFHAAEENGRMVFQGEDVLFDLPLPRMEGRHQIDNAGTAISACLRFAAEQGIELSSSSIEQGVLNAFWPGRMQRLKHGTLVDHLGANNEIWLDGGHNPGAAEAIARWLDFRQETAPKKLVLVCGMLTTKDPSGYFDALARFDCDVICVPIVSSDAGFDASELAHHARKSGINADIASDLTAALAMIETPEKKRVLIAGSLYLVGDALAQNGTLPD